MYCGKHKPNRGTASSGARHGVSDPRLRLQHRQDPRPRSRHKVVLQRVHRPRLPMDTTATTSSYWTFKRKSRYEL